MHETLPEMPEIEQLVAFVLEIVRVDEPPATIVEGEAVTVMAGGGFPPVVPPVEPPQPERPKAAITEERTSVQAAVLIFIILTILC